MQSPRQRNAVRLILDEHKQLSAVIHGMLGFVRLIDKGEKAPGLMVFRAMLYYIREYPEQVHHPKEDQYLFARLRDRTSELDETLAELESQHTQGEALVRELEHALTRYELEGSSAFRAFRDLVEKYAKFYFSHMRLEEEVILPAARRLLTPEDWTVVDAAFAGNRDPFAGADLKGGLEKLFLLIVNIIPAPDGLGPAI
ncbi:hemerythrin domain-containing protein [Polaromonas sp. P1(28)-13]|nr:hemerythrin domain-containing protein [Polaromonas sp. P1(28)-13]